MQNLAGRDDADKFIRRELERARVPVEETQRHTGEVSYSLIGRLGNFVFIRAWYYWVVKGPMPIELAEELYADPVGQTDIRVAGHAGCPPPEEWSELILPTGGWGFSDDPEFLGARRFVTSYHIDSEVGLRIFADAIRSHVLATTPASP